MFESIIGSPNIDGILDLNHSCYLLSAISTIITVLLTQRETENIPSKLVLIQFKINHAGSIG